MIHIVQAKLDLQEMDLMSLVRENSMFEYDCSPQEFMKYIVNVFHHPSFKFWVAYDKIVPVGYIIVNVSTGLKNSINLFDVYVKPWYRKPPTVFKMLCQQVIDMGKTMKLPIVFGSKRLDGIWPRVFKGHKFSTFSVVTLEV